MEIRNLSEAEFKTLVVRMIKELIGYFNSVKETQAEMKVTLSEIKENVQEVNSGVDEDIYLFDPCCTQGLELGWHKVGDQEIFVQGSN